MKRLLIVLVPCVVLLLGAALVVPLLIDWDKYKPIMITEIKKASGYDVTINGPISLSILPTPHVKIEDLSIAAPRGREPVLLSMKSAEVSVNLFSLFSGTPQVDTVRLINPDIKLEKLADGTPSWMSDVLINKQELQEDKSYSDTSSLASDTAVPLALNAVQIENGTITYTDRASGQNHTAEQISLTIKAQSLTGPFDAKGRFELTGQAIAFEIKAGKMTGEKKESALKATITLPKTGADISFGGVLALAPMPELQGQLTVKSDNLAATIASITGGDAAPVLSQSLSFTGLVTASQTALSATDLAVTFGETSGKGDLQILNLKDRNPVQILGDLSFEGGLNLDQVNSGAKSSAPKSVEERVAKGQTLAPSKPTLIPATISVPLPVDIDLKLAAESVQWNGKTLRGVTGQFVKQGSGFNLKTTALEAPGKTSGHIDVKGRFQSTSKSGDAGVTYADPAITFSMTGTSEQLPSMLRAFVQGQDKNAAMEIWKTGAFDLEGTITPQKISVRDSRLTLEQTKIALAGSYAPSGAGGKPDITLDVTSDTLNLDEIQARLVGQKKQAVQQDPKAQPDLKKSFEPVQGINVPANVVFDLSAQNIILNEQSITGVRIKGSLSGNALTLETASSQNIMGAQASLKGKVGDLKALSGVDLSFYGKTQDAKALLESFKVDTAKLPDQIKAAEVNIAATGSANDLSFEASMTAMDGTVKAKGKMMDALGKPVFQNLTFGASHPNLMKAIQIFNPSFAGSAGLERPFSFEGTANKQDNGYTLPDFKANLGPTTLSGTLTIATGDKTAVSGRVRAGAIPLDSFLGAKKTESGAGGRSSAKAGSGAQGSSPWSRNTIETGWMQTFTLDLDVEAQNITYGGWNFKDPKTKIVLKDGTLNIDQLEAGLFGGAATLSAKIQDPADPKQPLSMAVQSQMKDVALEPLAAAMGGNAMIQATGNVDFTLDVSTIGLSPHALVSGLKGSAALNGQNVVFDGFDLAQLALAFIDTGKPMDRLNSLVGGAVSGGQTRFDTIEGTYAINEGIATITAMKLDGPSATITSTGGVNLPVWTIDTLHNVVLKQAKEEGAFTVAIKGPLSNPGNTFGRALFADVLTRRAQQKVMEKLPDVLGDDLGGKLQDLGILPRQQSAPPVDPAAPAPPPSDPSAAPPQADPQAQPAPPPAPSLEEQIINDPERALQGVLDGLLR